MARSIADGAVERLVDEQHLEHAFARLERLVRVHLHYLPLGNGGRAGRRQLGRLLDLDEAHAAHADDGESRVIAVVRDQDAGRLRRFEDVRSRGHGDLPSLHGERDRGRRCRRWRRHATAGTGSIVRRLIRASKSARNLLMPDTTGVAQESLRTQIVLPVMLSAMLSSVSRSSVLPSPAAMRSTIFVVHAVPSRHCVHCAQLSCAKNRAARAMNFTRFWASSTTMTPPEPSIVPWATKPS